jgi:predicted phosphodiesterase
MRKFLQFLFQKPIAWLAKRLSSAPREVAVFTSLSKLLKDISANKTRRGINIGFNYRSEKFIIFSDQHKGNRNYADDFAAAENDYLAALQYYHEQDYHFINLGDCEELWKYMPDVVIKSNGASLLAEKKFLDAGKYTRIYGNHDLEWKFSLQRNIYLKPVFGKKLKVFEGVVLRTTYQSEDFAIFLAHGHQGDLRNDGNAFSVWVVANIWTPIQRYLRVHINTPATSFELTDKHNIMMYEWSATQHNLIFISGHTHKPVFASLDHLEKLTKQLEAAKLAKDEAAIASINRELEKRKAEYSGKRQLQTIARPSYFNSGCCCFDDGDITGIEISDGHIRLIKWHTVGEGSQRLVLEEAELEEIFDALIAGTQRTESNPI